MITTDIIFKLTTILMIMTKMVETDRAVDWKLNIHRRGPSVMIIKMIAVIIIITIMMTRRRLSLTGRWIGKWFLPVAAAIASSCHRPKDDHRDQDDQDQDQDHQDALQLGYASKKATGSFLVSCLLFVPCDLNAI